jgi:3-isopropylmalate/(R)-2-methylmalate dehydratase large subunit
MIASAPVTLFDKLWSAHVVAPQADDRALLWIDRHVLHEVTSPQAFSGLRAARRRVRHPELTFATNDHIVSTAVGRTDDSVPGGSKLVRAMRENAVLNAITLFDIGDDRQGIVHVFAPELGIALPGCTLVCGDSHTCTVGALGALSWGIGTSEVEHVLATQCLSVRKPRTMRVRFDGKLQPGVTAKDMILRLIGSIGANGAGGYAVEYAGSAIAALSMEARFTICNMSIECGARFGIIAPDDTTVAYVAGRPYAPRDRRFEAAVDYWRGLSSDEGAAFDREVVIDVGDLSPQVTWGTSPMDVIGVDGHIPDPAACADPARAAAMIRALAYMDLRPGDRLEDMPIQTVFIGSCTNSRLSDLQAAAAVIRGGKVAPGVRALVVPGSGQVAQAARELGLDRTFRQAGFEWREPGCSMCAGLNGDFVEAGHRCVSTSNRNFEGRQGTGSRTHLASPAMAAAAAIAGRIVDIRKQRH